MVLAVGGKKHWVFFKKKQAFLAMKQHCLFSENFFRI